MSSETSSRLQQFIRRLREEAVPPEDMCLWNRYVQSGDQAAFEILVYRHGPMVLACAHRLLSNRTDSEDVFQATFLSLARSKHRIRDSKALSSWLYKTTFRCALRLRAQRKQAVPLYDETLSSNPTESDPAWREVKGALDEELSKLPERLRMPLVLCYLNGLSRDEAAKQLGWSFTLLKRRLEEGRRVLRVRLERRGISAAGLALAVLSPQALQAMVSPTLVNSCLALIFCKETSLPAGIAALVMSTSAITKGLVMKSIAMAVLCSGLGIWTYTSMGQGLAPQEKPVVKAGPGTIGDTSRGEIKSEERTASYTQQLRSLDNLKKILLAVHEYMDFTKINMLPADFEDENGKPLLSWRVELLPFLGEKELYKQFHHNEPWDSEQNLKLMAKMPEVYRVGFESKDSTHTHYQVFAGPGTPLHPVHVNQAKGGPGGSSKNPRNLITVFDVTDGMSNTLGVIEAGPAVPWTKPADIPFDPTKPLTKIQALFSNSLHLAMMDGSTHAIRPGSVEEKTMKAFIGMNEGEIVPEMSSFRARIIPISAAEKEDFQQRTANKKSLLEKIIALQTEQKELLKKFEQPNSDLSVNQEMIQKLESKLEKMQWEVAWMKRILEEVEKKEK